MAKPNRRRRTTLRKISAGGTILALVIAAVVVLLRKGPESGGPVTGQPAPPPPVSFTHEVRPLLAGRCWECHQTSGPAQPPLDREDVGLFFVSLATGEGKTIVPDDETHRELLAAREQSLLIRWCAEGGNLEPHWAFQPLPGSVPIPEHPDGAKAPAIDRFIAASRGGSTRHHPARADRLTLLRRVTLDLVGRPPTVEEAEAILAAEDFGDAYRSTVDRLLGDPAFAENFGAWWMQAICYCDGTRLGGDANFSHWRNWVVRAFRDNLRMDEFLGKQLAGDLVSPPDPVATAIFLSPLRDPDRAASRGEAGYRLGRAFLGLPLDKDSASEADLAHLESLFTRVRPTPPVLDSLPAGFPVALLATAEQRDEIASLDSRIESLLDQIREFPAQEDFTQWLTQETILPVIPGLAALVDCNSRGPALTNGALGQPAQVQAPGATLAAGVHQSALVLKDEGQLTIAGAPTPSLIAPWSVAFWMRLSDPGKTPATILSCPGESGGLDLRHHGNALTLCWWRNGRAQSIILQAPLAAAHAGAWHHLVLTSSGTGDTGGFSLFLNGRPVTLRTVQSSLQKLPFPSASTTAPLHFGPPGTPGVALLLDEVAVYDRPLSPIEVRQLWDQQALSDALAKPQDHADDLRAYYLANFHDGVAALRDELQSTLNARADLVASLATTPVLRDPGPQREARPLLAGIPAGAIPPPITSREDLARSLLREDHPLTARAFVNRTWAHFLGRPFVAPMDNLGLESGPCQTPALLDWLARNFVSNSWDFRGLCRQIVLSRHYQEVRPEASPLPEHVQHDLPLAWLDPSRHDGVPDLQPWIHSSHPPALGEDAQPQPLLLDKTARIRLARALSLELLTAGPESDEDRLRHLFLKLRCQEETHPDFSIFLGYLKMRRESPEKTGRESPVVVVAPGIAASPDLDPQEWAAWLDLCSSLLEDPDLRNQR